MPEINIEYIEHSKPEIRVTYKKILEALIKNGFIHLRGGWFDYNSLYGGIYIGGCVLGQTAMNLGAESSNLTDALDEIKITFDELPEPIKTKKIHNNYYDGGSYGLGGLLIYMNDAFDSYKNEYYFSWDDLVDAATFYMQPYLKNKVTLPTESYKVVRKVKDD